MDAALPSRGRRGRSVLVGLAMGAAVAACGSSPSGPLNVGDAQNGQTVTVAHGQKVVVSLPGTAWQFTLDPAFGPLTEVSSRLSSGGSSAMTVVYVAGTKGSATVGAHRSCGRGRCPAGTGQFRLTVDVTG